MKGRPLLFGGLFFGGLQFIGAFCFFWYIKSLDSLWWGNEIEEKDLLACLFAGVYGFLIGLTAAATKQPLVGAFFGFLATAVAYGLGFVFLAFIMPFHKN